MYRSHELLGKEKETYFLSKAVISQEYEYFWFHINIHEQLANYKIMNTLNKDWLVLPG